MIRSETEYRGAVKRLAEQDRRLVEQRSELVGMGLEAEEVKRTLDPMRSFHQHLSEEVEAYERLRRGEFDEVRNLREIGRLLIAARIYRGVSQRELGEKLGVPESQVSRDERNEYRGVTLERATRILDVLDVVVRSRVEAASEEVVV